MSTFVFGARLGFRRSWRWLGQSALAGTSVVLFWYSAATLSAPDPNGQNDHSAGIGVVIFSVPTFVAVALLLCVGAVACVGVRWLVRER